MALSASTSTSISTSTATTRPRLNSYSHPNSARTPTVIRVSSQVESRAHAALTCPLPLLPTRSLSCSPIQLVGAQSPSTYVVVPIYPFTHRNPTLRYPTSPRLSAACISCCVGCPHLASDFFLPLTACHCHHPHTIVTHHYLQQGDDTS